MYTYSNNMPQYSSNMYYNTNNDERLVGGFVAPLLLGGVAGYAIGQNNNWNNGWRPMVFYPQPYPYYRPYNPWYYNRWYR